MAPAWRAAPLPKAHCAAAAAIEATATEPWTEAQLLQELDAPAGRLFGLYAGETLCGAAVFQLAADEASLESVTITPEHRGQGAGRALLTHALAALKAEGPPCAFWRCGPTTPRPWPCRRPWALRPWAAAKTFTKIRRRMRW